MKSKVARVKSVKRRLADGTVKEYRYTVTDKTLVEETPDTLGDCLIAYKKSPEYARLSGATKELKRYYFAMLGSALINVALLDVRRRTLLAIRDTVAANSGNASANGFVSAMRVVFKWAVDREWIETNPLTETESLATGAWPAWTTEQADYAVTVLPEPLRRLVILGRYTAQRRGDLIKMTWFDYDGKTIKVLQEKGSKDGKREPMLIPVHSKLKIELDKWKNEAKTSYILTSFHGKPWKAHTVTTMVARYMPTVGLPGLSTHGLRKLGATELAQAGCTTHQIAAVTGHKTLAMVQHYTASVEQADLAKSAMELMERAGKKAIVVSFSQQSGKRRVKR